jgi:hypothetical protein
MLVYGSAVLYVLFGMDGVNTRGYLVCPGTLDFIIAVVVLVAVMMVLHTGGSTIGNNVYGSPILSPSWLFD